MFGDIKDLDLIEKLALRKSSSLKNIDHYDVAIYIII
jgi:hypothetical protein